MVRVFGLKSCDTCRRARQWLDSKKVAYCFVDVRSDGLTESDLKRWAKAVGWETLLNRRGTTWRKLDEAAKTNLTTTRAIRLMSQNPALVKRPVFETADGIRVGFSAEAQAALAKMLA